MYFAKTAVIVCLSSAFESVKQSFRDDLPKAWFDYDEVDEIILRVFTTVITNILSSFDPRILNSINNKECYQGTIDYLEFSGLTQEGAFRISHQSEMLILKSIVDTCPNLDDTSLFKISNFSFKNKKDLFIICEIINETNSYNSNRPYRGLV